MNLVNRGGRWLLSVFVLAFCVAAKAEAQDWIETSNDYSAKVLEMMSKYSPEGAGSLGVDGFDEQIMDLGENLYERSRADSEKMLA